MNKSKTVRVLHLLAVAFAGLTVFAQDGVWIGAGSDGRWTNADNWRGGVIPGRIMVDGVLQGQGGDVATFGAVTANAQTTVDLTGVSSIGGIEIVGADAPAYVFGTKNEAAQYLNLEAGGAGLSVGTGVVNAPTITGRYRAVYVLDDKPMMTICNMSADCVLNLPSVSSSVKSPDYSGSITISYIDFRGDGDIRIGGSTDAGYGDFGWYLNLKGKLVIGVNLTGGYGKYTAKEIIAGDIPTVSRIEVEEGIVAGLTTKNGPSFNVEHSDVEISGLGTWGFNWRAGYDKNDTRVRIAKGRKLTIYCKYMASCDQGSVPGVRTYKGTSDSSVFYGGDWAFCGENETPGPLQNFFGNMETDRAGGFGQGEIQLASGSILRYVGADDWTMTQNACVTNWPSRTGLSGVFEAIAGKGVWTLAGELSQHNSADGGTGTFTFQGDGTGTIAGVILNGAGARVTEVVKSGTGTWAIAGVNSYTGGTTLNDGVLKIEKTGSIASSSGVTLNGGSLDFDGDAGTMTQQTLRKIAIASDATLNLTGRVTVNVAEVSRTAGVLHVFARSADSRLVVPVGTSASCFTWNGQPAVIGADGTVSTAADAIIAARGDVVPNNGGDVLIAYDGTAGNDMLAAEMTTVAKLRQVSKVAATVEIGSGKMLSVPELELDESAADLTLGAVGDKGVLGSSTGAIVYENASTASKLRVRTAIAEGVTNALEEGVVELSGNTSLAMTTIATAAGARAGLEIRGGAIDTGMSPIVVGNNTGTDYSGGGMQYGELTVSNALVCNRADAVRVTRSYSAPADYAILVGKNASGILRVQDGAVISNKLQVGTGIGGSSGRGSGAVYQSGGRVVTLGGAGYLGNVIGNGSAMGYYELSGGAFEGSMAIGTYSYGIWHQEPATEADMKALSIASANGARADVYVRGVMTVTNDDSLLCGGFKNGNLSVVTVDDQGVVDCGLKRMYAFNSAIAATSLVNVARGGKIKASFVYRWDSAYGKGGLFDVSFDGGSFVCTSALGEIFANPYGTVSRTSVDNVRIYKRGMTVDTAGNNTGTAVPLQRPTGKGVSSIPFDFASFAKWNTPPYIEIEGDGTGAAAHALFDSSSQMVTGVVITCSGVGYTVATAKAVYKGNSCPAARTVACVLSENDTTGGFTKTGSGTFTLNGVCTYEGETVVKCGTLKAGVDNAIPANAAIVLAGGTLDFNGKAGSVSRVTYKAGGGSILNATNVTLPATFGMETSAADIFSGRSVALSGDQDLAGKALTVTGDFSSLDPEVCRRYTVVSVSGGKLAGSPTIISPALPENWRFVTNSSGVKLAYSEGLVLIVR